MFATTPPSSPQHLAVPFQIDNTGSAVVVDQDSFLDVAQCVQTLLATPQGSRLELPQYGVPDPTFTDGHLSGLEQAVQQWEPRAAGARIPVVINPDGTATVTALITPGGDR